MSTKKYLPEYFFGDEKSVEKKTDVNKPSNLTLTEDFHVSEPNLSRIPSPASSLASTKKLEWDSGADIGYIYDSVKHSVKSRSYPSLHMDISPISRVNKSDETSELSAETPAGNIESDNKSNKNFQASEQQNIKMQSNSKIKSTFKHSTPNESKNSQKDYFKSNRYLNKDECLQTTLVHISSKGVQTDFHSSNEFKNTEKIFVNKSLQTESCHSYTESSSSKSGSFQYIPGSNFESRTSSENIINSPIHSEAGTIKTDNEENHSTSSKKSQPKSNSDHSPTNSLDKIIATQQSSHLITDIDKSLYILQKFIRSKRHNRDMKKHYAKKIVSKIISSKYSDDSNSSSSINLSEKTKSSTEMKKSDENLPSNNEIIINNKLTAKDIIIQTDENEFISNYKKDAEIPIQIPKYDLKNQETYKKLIDKSSQYDLNDQFIKSPKNQINDETDRTSKTRNSIKKSITTDKTTLIDHKINLYNHISDQLKSIENSAKKPADISSNKSKSDSTNSYKEFKNWRQNKTLSEKILEVRKKYNLSNNIPTNIHNNGDYLLRHSRNERKRQLSWINNEITYLHKLKELLNDTSASNSRPSTVTSSFDEIIEIKPHRHRDYKLENSSTSTTKDHNAKHLSKILTNEEIKCLIDGDTRNLHCLKTCPCCRHQKSIFTTSAAFVTKKNHEVKEKSNEITKENNKAIYNYNSHEHHNSNIKKGSPTKLDAGIQCTLKKNKIYSDNNETSAKTIYVNKNVPNHNFSSSTSEEIQKPYPKKQPTTGKENKIFKKKKPTAFKSSTAYFLQFEEESQYETSTNGQNSLERITIKIPKYRRDRNRKTDSDKNCTLQEYLKKNRPDFFRNAEWRRNQLLFQKKEAAGVFTCKEMQEITLKQYKKLPEVQNKIRDEKIKNERRHNRCMAHVFSKKLQKKALRGQVTLATCANVIE